MHIITDFIDTEKSGNLNQKETFEQSLVQTWVRYMLLRRYVPLTNFYHTSF